MDSYSPRPESIDPSASTVAGYLRLRLENDGEWWTLFHPKGTRDQIVEILTGLGIFQSPLLYRDFIEDNTMAKIVRKLWCNAGSRSIQAPLQIEQGFARLKEVLIGRDPSRRALTLMLTLTPLCSTSPSNLKAVLGEPMDMAVMCGHDNETRTAWSWFKSLLCTLFAFFWHEQHTCSPALSLDRDSEEVDEILRRAAEATNRRKWKVLDKEESLQADWLKASFQGRYRSNRTRGWWRQIQDDRQKVTCLHELIAARITDQCPENGLLGLWLEGDPDVMLGADLLGHLSISPDPWERLDRVGIPMTGATSQLFETPVEFDPTTLPPPVVHQGSGIPFELVKGFPCVSKERQLFL